MSSLAVRDVVVCVLAGGGGGGLDVACPGLSGTALALVAADNKLEHYVKVLKSNGALLFAAKFFVTAPVVYHYVGGLRHLVRYTF